MQPLKVQAWMGSPIAGYDDWSPDLAGLLEYLLLDRLHLASPNPTPEQVEETRAIVDEQMPIRRGDLDGEWYWQTSGPCYTIKSEQIDKFRKRWDCQEHNLNWGKRKAKWSTSEGPEKSYDLPLYLRSTSVITWYCVGNLVAVADLLNDCTGVGKKRSHGYGQITKWEVELCEHDWHLWRNGMLMRPIPLTSIPQDRPVDFSILDWGWRPPAWLHSNKTRCAMPGHTVRKLSEVVHG